MDETNQTPQINPVATEPNSLLETPDGFDNQKAELAGAIKAFDYMRGQASTPEALTAVVSGAKEYLNQLYPNPNNAVAEPTIPTTPISQEILSQISSAPSDSASQAEPVYPPIQPSSTIPGSPTEDKPQPLVQNFTVPDTSPSTTPQTQSTTTSLYHKEENT